ARARVSPGALSKSRTASQLQPQVDAASRGPHRAMTRRMHLAQDRDTLPNHLDAILWEADASGRVDFVSDQAERLLGFPREEWLDDADFRLMLIHPEDREVVETTAAWALKNPSDYSIDYRVVAADGRTVWVRDAVHVVTGANGRVARLRGVMLDI